jgi:hypothetical protein
VSQVGNVVTACAAAVHSPYRPRHAAIGAARLRIHPSHMRFGYRRLHDGPAMSVVYYVLTDTDDLLISTMADPRKPTR